MKTSAAVKVKGVCKLMLLGTIAIKKKLGKYEY